MIDFFWNSAHSVMDISVLLRDWQSGASQPKRNCLARLEGGSPGKKGRLFRNKLEIESFCPALLTEHRQRCPGPLVQQNIRLLEDGDLPALLQHRLEVPRQ